MPGPAAPYASEEQRWRAVAARDARADGAFWTCVRTTGVYCRPSCPARPLRKNVAFAESRLAAERKGFRPCKRCRPDRFVNGPVQQRLADIDWPAAQAALDKRGFVSLGAMLSDDECGERIASYDDDRRYRSTIVMQRHGFGAGEYRYFADPPPPLVGALRKMLYPHFVPLAEEWAKRSGAARRWPKAHDDYRKLCARQGQSRPTPLILKYGPGDFNRLHQDLYGDEVFPVQVAVLLSEPGKDFEGGDFILTEQRPRMQSRAEAVPFRRGDAVAFAVNDRPVTGARGAYRVKMRHGVSTVRAGARYCLGIIFHDAA